jgi:hypothetical protein
LTPTKNEPRRLLISFARPEAYGPLTQVILAKLGYGLVQAEAWGELPEEVAAGGPDLAIADERRLSEVWTDGREKLRTVALTGRNGLAGDDPRVVAVVQKPAGLHELYRVLQATLEPRPRSTPRIPTYLPASCRQRGREWRAAVVSLSENGCLLRSPEPVPLGSELQVSFDLPRVGRVETSAESAYQLVPDLGLVFSGAPAASRRAILDFVEQTLAIT